LDYGVMGCPLGGGGDKTFGEKTLGQWGFVVAYT